MRGREQQVVSRGRGFTRATTCTAPHRHTVDRWAHTSFLLRSHMTCSQAPACWPWPRPHSQQLRQQVWGCMHRAHHGMVGPARATAPPSFRLTLHASTPSTHTQSLRLRPLNTKGKAQRPPISVVRVTGAHGSRPSSRHSPPLPPPPPLPLPAAGRPVPAAAVLLAMTASMPLLLLPPVLRVRAAMAAACGCPAVACTTAANLR